MAAETRRQWLASKTAKCIKPGMRIEIGGKPVKNIGGYMTAMSTQKAGHVVDVVVLRKGTR